MNHLQIKQPHPPIDSDMKIAQLFLHKTQLSATKAKTALGGSASHGWFLFLRRAQECTIINMVYTNTRCPWVGCMCGAFSLSFSCIYILRTRCATRIISAPDRPMANAFVANTAYKYCVECGFVEVQWLGSIGGLRLFEINLFS